MMLHEARPDIPPSNPGVFSRAYGELNFEKVRRWLVDEDARLRIQAVEELIDMYVERREYAVISLKYEMLEILITTLIGDEVDEIRERAGAALEMLLRERPAQQVLLGLSDNPLQELLKALHDSSDGVVVITLRAFIAAHSFTNEFRVTEELVRLGVIDHYMELLSHENVVVVAVTCAALVPVFDIKEMNVVFLRQNGMQLVTRALASNDAMLVTEAAELLSKACETQEGRRVAVESGTIAALAAHVTHENLSARVGVCSALAQITVLEKARFQAVEVNLPPVLLELLSTEDERDVLVHVARLLIHLGEFKEGRDALRSSVPRLEELVSLAGEDLAIAVPLQKAISVLSRK
ncbi:hypothetical protein AGDE_06309 [Angomonas deanei]|nr:hypothetical protein AGDE_06309 [Angomonas deanei]|eukprot:EPY37625.1 hypothetical protein AGDE_06309 [Angomonas deanei]